MKRIGSRGRLFPVARKRRELARTHPELSAELRNDVLAFVLAHWPRLRITSTTGGVHAPGSLHNGGHAADVAVLFAGLSPSEILEARRYMGAASRWIMTNPKFVARLTEGIYNAPHVRGNLSVKAGVVVPRTFWGPDTWADHADHMHLGKV